jgi:hypothetical protein
MKKHPEANALAERLAVAANQPPAIVPFPAPLRTEATAADVSSGDSAAAAGSVVEKSARRERKPRSKAKTVEAIEDDTVPISLRPSRDLLTRYVLAASDRMRETGRAISAQQIMLEVLEQGP